jgi:outer membrane protein OmpA-like peptidoglycan-associated protein
MLFAIIALSLTANAQDYVEGQVPPLDAQIFRPSLDADRTLWTEDSQGIRYGGFQWWLGSGWVRNPLVYSYAGQDTALLGDAIDLNLGAGYQLGPLRLAGWAPLYLHETTDSPDVQTGVGLGDVGLDAKLTLIDRTRHEDDEDDRVLGLALAGRLGLPTATLDAPVGSRSLTGEVGVVADAELGSLLLAANLGGRILPRYELENVTLDEQLFARLGLGWALSEGGGLSVDLYGHSNLTESFGSAAATPVEALLGGWLRLDSGWELRGGAGTSLVHGVGAPDMRAVLAITRAVEGRREQEPDRDLDGIIDADDSCPDTPEDLDGVRDDDGCPETRVWVEVIDQRGDTLPQGSWTVAEQTGKTGDHVRLDQGEWVVRASAEGHRDGMTTVRIHEQATVDVRVVCPEPFGQLTVKASDEDGNPIPDATWQIQDSGAEYPVDEAVELEPGEVPIVAQAEGYRPVQRAVSLEDGQDRVLDITLLKNKRDRDEDGIADEDDECPREPEDRDGYHDHDGCPDLTTLRIVPVDQFGDEVPTATWEVDEQAGPPEEPAELGSGDWTVTTTAPGHEPGEKFVPLRGDKPEDEVRVLTPLILGELQVQVEDPEGEPIPTATWTLQAEQPPTDRAPGEQAELRPGPYVVVADAPGFEPAEREVDVQGKQPREIVVVLEPSEGDSDGDGLADSKDACPLVPEDMDGVCDEDGCPETRVSFPIEDQFGEPVPGATWTVGEQSGPPEEPLTLDEGPWTAVAQAPGHEPGEQSFTVEQQHELEVPLVVYAPTGSLIVDTFDQQGEPVPEARWWLDGDALDYPPGEQVVLRPAVYTVVVEADSYRTVREEVEIVVDERKRVRLDLLPAKAKVTAERIDIYEKVYFETAKADIRPESFDLLDEVADIILAHPELTLIRIEGHTDSRGSDPYNMRLSQDRASSVRAYLAARGVDEERLQAVGYGETRLIAEERSDEDLQRNRRVEFWVAERSD